MKPIYSDESIPENVQEMPSIFLAGPTPRHPSVQSWRPEALTILTTLGYTGSVFVPERKYDKKYEYLPQVEWEWAALHEATVICFWIPRDLEILPGFTTNVEFGRHVETCVYGRPSTAENCRYLDWLYRKITQRQPCSTLMETMKEATNKSITNKINVALEDSRTLFRAY